MKRDYVAIAEQYARDVLAGAVPGCRLVRLACERYLTIVAETPPDAQAVWRVMRTVENLPHVKGKWARTRENLILAPWQVFIVVNVFGLKRADGTRRYRRVYIEVPRKNGKSSLTAGLGLYMLADDDEIGAEVYSGATSEKQAWEVFGPARLMARNTVDYQDAFGVQVGAKNLHIIRTASKFEPIIGKPGDGASPSFSITDEYHEHPTADQYDTMVTGMGAREQPIAWVITTAGSDTSGPCYNLRQTAVETLEGKIENDELFALIYTIDETVDWTSEEALRMANPNMGVSVFDDFLRTEQRNAINNPYEQAKFKTKHLNIWVTAAAPYFNIELWNRLADPKLNEAEFYGLPCFIGLDLASKLDITAVIRLFVRDEQDGKHFYLFPHLYIPRSRAEDPKNRHYLGWVEGGYLTATPGEITDYDYIEADLKADAEHHSIMSLGADPHNATQLLTHLQSWIGADKVIEVPQTVVHLSEPMKEVQAVIVDSRIHHSGNPCLAWQIGNLTAQEDRNANVFPRKEREEKKIDGAVALIIAMNRALLHVPDPGPQLYILG